MNKTEINKISRTRNIAIDLLRILAMLMIVIWHSSNHGGLDKLSTTLNGYNLYIHYLQALTAVSVNVYVLISGYFLCTQNFRPSRILKLAIEVWVYSYGILLFCSLTHIVDLNLGDILKSVLPISYRLNWFVTSYIGLCIVAPFLNKFINALSQKQHLVLIGVLLATTSVYHDILPMSFAMDVYDGKRLSWFIVLYIVASYIRKYVDTKKPMRIKPFAVYLMTTALLFFVWIAIYWGSQYIGISDDIKDYGCKYYYSYSSIFVFMSAVSLFLTFLHIDISSEKIARIVMCIAPLTLGVYLIHDNYILRPAIWNMLDLNPEITIPQFVLNSCVPIVVFCGCLLIDFIRQSVFKYIYSTSFSKSFMDRFDTDVINIYNKIKL